MVGFLLFLMSFTFVYSNKLDRTYLPPPGSKYSGGSPGAIQVPLETSKEIYYNTISEVYTVTNVDEYDSGQETKTTEALPTDDPFKEIQENPNLTSDIDFQYTNFQGNDYSAPESTTSLYYGFEYTTNNPGTEVFFQADDETRTKIPKKNQYTYDSLRNGNLNTVAPNKKYLPPFITNKVKSDIEKDYGFFVNETKSFDSKTANKFPNRSDNINSNFLHTGSRKSEIKDLPETLTKFDSKEIRITPAEAKSFKNKVDKFNGSSKGRDSTRGLVPPPPISYQKHVIKSSIQNSETNIDSVADIVNYQNIVTPEQFKYSFDTSNGIHVEEEGTAVGGVKTIGQYSYTGQDGKIYNVTYLADENGFQPTGDHLPTPPPIPEAILKVIAHAARDKDNGIYDDGSYDEHKYGYEKYERIRNKKIYQNKSKSHNEQPDTKETLSETLYALPRFAKINSKSKISTEKFKSGQHYEEEPNKTKHNLQTTEDTVLIKNTNIPDSEVNKISFGAINEKTANFEEFLEPNAEQKNTEFGKQTNVSNTMDKIKKSSIHPRKEDYHRQIKFKMNSFLSNPNVDTGNNNYDAAFGYSTSIPKLFSIKLINESKISTTTQYTNSDNYFADTSSKYISPIQYKHQTTTNPRKLLNAPDKSANSRFASFTVSSGKLGIVNSQNRNKNVSENSTNTKNKPVASSQGTFVVNNNKGRFTVRPNTVYIPTSLGITRNLPITTFSEDVIPEDLDYSFQDKAQSEEEIAEDENEDIKTQVTFSPNLYQDFYDLRISEPENTRTFESTKIPSINTSLSQNSVSGQTENAPRSATERNQSNFIFQGVSKIPSKEYDAAVSRINIIGEDFSGSKRTEDFDAEAGYRYQ